MHRIPPLLPLLLLLLLTVASAQEDAGQHAGADTLVNFEVQMQETAERLGLDDAQRAELEPVLRAHFDEVRTLLGEYGLDRRPTRPPGHRQLMELANELEPLREQIDRDLQAVLSEDQMAEYRQLQKERRTRMRTRIRRGIY